MAADSSLPGSSLDRGPAAGGSCSSVPLRQAARASGETDSQSALRHSELAVDGAATSSGDSERVQPDGEHPWTMYVLGCADGSLYAGITTDPVRRVSEHNGELAGGARYTRARRPVRMLYAESHPDRSSATRAELAFKRLSRAQKDARVQRGESPR